MAVTKNDLENLLKKSGLRASTYQSSPWGSRQIISSGFYVGKEGSPPAGVWVVKWDIKILAKDPSQWRAKQEQVAAILRNAGLTVKEKDHGLWVSGTLKQKQSDK